MKTEIDGKTIYFGWSEDDIRGVVSKKMRPRVKEADEEYKEMIERHINLTLHGDEDGSSARN